MKLYTFDAAPNPRRVNLFLTYKGIKLPTQEVDLRTGQQFSADFVTISPRCIVPALELDDGTVICDAIAICWYLESRYPDRPLFGTEPLQQAQILSWDSFICSDGLSPIAEALRNRSDAFKDRALPGPERITQIPELESRGRKRLQSFWQRLDEHLAGSDFLIGSTITMADIDAFVVVGFAGWIKERIPEYRPHVLAWFQRVKPLLDAN